MSREIVKNLTYTDFASTNSCLVENMIFWWFRAEFSPKSLRDFPRPKSRVFVTN